MIRSFLNECVSGGKLVEHQIKSYNDFIDKKLQNIVNELGEIKIELPTKENLKIKLGRVKVGNPRVKESDGSVREILPYEARLRNLTYSAPLLIEMTIIFEDIEHETEFIYVGDLPVMVKSNKCYLSGMDKDETIKAGEDPKDPGGYFIINGTERVLIMSEDIVTNKAILQKKDDTISVRLDSKNRGYTQRHIFERKENGVIISKFANLTKTPIPIVVLIKALGLESDKEIIDIISSKTVDVGLGELYLNIYATEVTNQEEAFDYIGKKMRVMQKSQVFERVQRVLDYYLLPHLGQEPSDRQKKAKHLINVMHKLFLLQKGLIKHDDIDHYSNKRLKLSGDLLEPIIRAILIGKWGLVTRLQYNYQKMIKRGRKLLKLQSVITTDILTKQIMRSMAVGNWAGGQTGVSQRLERNNFVRMLGHLRNVVSPLSSTQEHFDARELHATHWGRLCIIRTPEGQNIGLRKFLALGAEITTTSSEDVETKVKNVLKNLGVNDE